MEKINIPESAYFHGDEINQFIHIQVPMDLIVADCFTNISGDAKILYGLLLNRTGLSIRNGWEDDKGRTFIHYTIEDVMGELHVSRSKAIRLFAELTNIICIDVDENGKAQWFGLIEKVRTLNKPSKIYVHKVAEVRAILESGDVDNSEPAEADSDEESDKTSGHNVQKSGENTPETAKIQVVSDLSPRKCQNWNHGSVRNEPTEVSDMNPRWCQECDDGGVKDATTVISEMSPRLSQNCDVNNKDINNNNYIYNNASDNDSINHKKRVSEAKHVDKRLMDEMACTQIMYRNSVDYDYLSKKPGIDKGLLDDAINLMVEASTFPGRVIVNKDVMPLELVQSTFEKYDRDIMEYALVQIEKHIIGVTNMKNYMLAVLFNAVSTFNGNMYMEVHEDRLKPRK